MATQADTKVINREAPKPAGLPALALNQIYMGDAVKLMKQIPDRSVDLIFTDPPYISRLIWLYGWLGQEAVRVLKPEGFLLAYVGNYWKCNVMALLRKHMSYFWDYTIIHGGDSPIQHNRRTIARTKSILCYVPKGSSALPRVDVLGAYDGRGASKEWHKWGQHVEEAYYYIDCFARPGATVLDPFVGGGTTAVACKLLGLNWLCFELDDRQAEVARRRVETVSKL